LTTLVTVDSSRYFQVHFRTHSEATTIKNTELHLLPQSFALKLVWFPDRAPKTKRKRIWEPNYRPTRLQLTHSMSQGVVMIWCPWRMVRRNRNISNQANFYFYEFFWTHFRLSLSEIMFN